MRTAALPRFFAPVLSATKTKKVKSSHHPVRLAFGYALIAVNAVLVLAYLFGVNSYASDGYEINQLQNQIANLTTQNRQLTVQTSENSSIISIQNSFQNSNFVPVGQVKFLQVNQYSER